MKIYDEEHENLHSISRFAIENINNVKIFSICMKDLKKIKKYDYCKICLYNYGVIALNIKDYKVAEEYLIKSDAYVPLHSLYLENWIKKYKLAEYYGLKFLQSNYDTDLSLAIAEKIGELYYHNTLKVYILYKYIFICLELYIRRNSYRIVRYFGYFKNTEISITSLLECVYKMRNQEIMELYNINNENKLNMSDLLFIYN
jgi:hypothetical protein